MKICISRIKHKNMSSNEGEVTGIGGVFFKCENPERQREWYQQQLGLKTDQYGTTFQWRSFDQPGQIGHTVWSPFKNDSAYFEPSTKPYMINFRVKNLDALLAKLREQGVLIIGEVQTFEYGRFAHIMDPEGNKIELWEPQDDSFQAVLNPDAITK